VPPTSPPIVTLLTDFGAGSGYPAQMKGVLLARLPEVRIVDLSHDVPPFDVLAGALLLEDCVPAFPAHAVHCAVVDPGVGTSRRPLCVVAPGGLRFVGPDNGLFTSFLGEGSACYLLEDPELVPSPASATFHGRDLFAPVAAWLAGGGAAARLGRAVADPVRLQRTEPRWLDGALRGELLVADPFGNLATSIRRQHLPAGPLEVEIAGRRARLVVTYGDARPGELVALLGSSGRLELSVREGSAARELGLARGAEVLVRAAG
jgi:S-adenosylmethionine hydrolase